MIFCPKCGAILVPKKVGSKTTLSCSCGYSTKEIDNATISEEVKDKAKEVEVVEKDFEAMPMVKTECPKCKNPESYFWEIQTRASDEPATKFHKCTKCKHVWRDYK